MARAALHEETACRLLVNRYLKPLLNLAARLLQNRADAEDMVQEAFIRLWREAPHWRGQAKVGTWLHQIVYHACIDRLRQRTVLPLEELEEPLYSEPETDPLATLQLQEAAQLVEQAMAALPPRQRAAILMVHYQEFHQVDAAQVLGIGVEALESLLARGRRKLRQLLAESIKG
ncbi:MAG: sigma-70 family RNA polymerase sigma factor [Magnetococcales bacterium]|nr:sigma-70 family RNA polymerase sigma factor [Magnetococcales bacterium]